MVHRSGLVALGCVALGCSTLLGLSEFEDAPATAGTGGTAGAAGASGIGGSAASSGNDGAPADADADGAPVLYTCTTAHDFDPLLTSAQLAGTTASDLELELARGPSGHIYVLANRSLAGSDFIMAFIRFNEVSQSPATVFNESDVDASGIQRIRVTSFTATTTRLYVGGTTQSSYPSIPAIIEFQLDGMGVPTVSNVSHPNTPCIGNTLRAVFAPGDDPAKPRYVVTCDNPGGDLIDELHICDSSGSCTQVNTADAIIDDMNINRYVNIGGVHLMQSESGHNWWGSDPAALNHAGFNFTKDDAALAIAYGAALVPRTDGATLIAGAADANDLSDVQIHGGSLVVADFDKLATRNPLPLRGEVTLDELPFNAGVGFDDYTISAAGGTVDHSQLTLWEFNMDGTPRVMPQRVEPSTPDDSGTTEYHKGGAIPATPYTFVVWAQSTKVGDASTEDAVRARALTCYTKQ